MQRFNNHAMRLGFNILKKQHSISQQLYSFNKVLKRMSGTIPKIIGNENIDDDNWKNLFKPEPSVFEKISSGKFKKSDGLIFMIGFRNAKGEKLSIVERPSLTTDDDSFTLNDGGLVLLSEELSDSIKQQPRVVSRTELPFNLENPGENEFQEVYLHMNYQVGSSIDYLADKWYEEVESVQIYYFTEDSKQPIMASIERYKDELQGLVDSGYQSTGTHTYTARILFSVGDVRKFIELLKNVQYQRVSTFYQLPIPPLSKNRRQLNIYDYTLILFILLVTFYDLYATKSRKSD